MQREGEIGRLDRRRTLVAALRRRSRFRATANSLQSFSFRLLFAIFGPAVGYTIDHYGMKSACAALAVIFGLCLVGILRPLIKEVQKQAPAYIPETEGESGHF